ncbi:MAG: tetratricopeptide repeat protein [Candidatus Kapabacteria bacterium]|nr:tetratricopeptide repeat protein [Candidatus Kapabacteria bacterium]
MARKQTETLATSNADVEEITKLIQTLQRTTYIGNEQKFTNLEQKLLKKSTAIQYNFGILYATYLRAYKLMENGQYVTATSLFEKCFQFYAPTNDYLQLSKIRRNHAFCLLKLGLYTQAGKLYHQAHELTLKTDDKEITSASLYGIANFYHTIGNYEQSVEYYLQSLKLIEGMNLLANESTTYNNIGIVYQESGNYTLAIEYLHKALALKQQLGNAFSIASTLTNLGNTYVLLDDTKNGFEYLNRSLEIKLTLNNEMYCVSSYMGLSTAHFKSGNVQEAMRNCTQALAIAEKYNDFRLITDSKLLLGKTLALAKDHEQAFTVLMEYIDQNNAHHKREFKQTLAELSVAFDVENSKREAEHQRLLAENLQQELELKNQELTAQALILAQKNEMFGKLKEQIQGYRQSNTSSNQILQKLEQEIESNIQSHSSWTVFEQQFNTIHQTFMQRLSEKYPTLSPTELRLCALLKINLRTKEIANVLCLSAKSIEIYRFRLRKKLGLQQDVNLTSFLSGL